MAKTKPQKAKPAPALAPPAVTPAWATALWYAGAGLVFWSFGYTIMRGSDLWWHLAGGRWMWQARTFWVADPFSYSQPGTKWLNDAWLSDVLLYAWTQALSLESLAYWKWAMVVVTWVLLFRLAWRLCGDAASAFLATLLSIAVAEPFLDVRPQLFSFLGWVALLELCLARPRPSRWVPILMMLWANLHAGFFLGLIALPLLLLPHVVAATGQARRDVVILGGLGVLACLLNPNGVEVITRPLLHAFDNESPFRTLGEWLPPFKPGGIQAPLLSHAIAVLAVSGSIAAWEAYRSPKRLAAAVPLILALMTLAMALQSRRFVPLFAMTQVLVVAPVLAKLLAPLSRRLPELAGPAATVGLGLWWMSSMPVASHAFDDLTARDTFPIENCGFIESNRLAGNVFAYYNWGGFVQLCSGGRMKVFIDGRAETVYADDNFLDYLTVLNGRRGWQDVVEKSGADFVLWPLTTGWVAAELPASGRWRVLHEDMVSVLLARADLPLPAVMKPSPDSAYRSTRLGMERLKEENVGEALAHFGAALAADPYSLPACMAMARTQALTGQFDAAHATGDRCGGMTTDASQIAALHGFIEKARALAAGR